MPMAERVSLRLAAHIEAYTPLEVTLPWNEPGNPRRHGKPVTAALMFTKDGGAAEPLARSTRARGGPPRNAAGITEGSLHQLRHLFASALLAGGVDIKALSEYLGHHDPSGDAADLRPPDALGRGPRAAGDRGGFRGG